MRPKQEESTEIENFEDDELEDDDYVFVVSAEGELKTLIFPDELMENPPKEVQKILKLFGITNIHQMEPRTLN